MIWPVHELIRLSCQIPLFSENMQHFSLNRELSVIDSVKFVNLVIFDQSCVVGKHISDNLLLRIHFN